MSDTANPPAKEKDPHLPPMGRLGNVICPRAPQTISEMRLEDGALIDLAAKFAYSMNRFTSTKLADRMSVSPAVASAVTTHLSGEGMIEETLSGSKGKEVYRITERGRIHAERAIEVNAYLGPAPVSLEAYSALIRWQFAQTPEVKSSHVISALSNLVLNQQAIELAGLAVSSGRSLFVYGPAGNGKSSLGRAIHSAMQGDVWVPHAISVRNSVIRMYDDQVHKRVEFDGHNSPAVDQRWVRIRRPMVVVGGELTLEYLDLIYSPSLRYYEAPPHLKSNGGVFLVDDFGRERVAPHQLLNRFITPMEHHFDYFTLATGQKIQVPLRHVLIIATNLSLEKVTDPAFLRRMGYRVCLEAPTPEQYAKIFTSYAAKQEAVVPPGILESLLERYRQNGRELRACEPRDLIERARDICRFRGQPLELTPDVLDLAWSGYFGNAAPPKPASGSAEASGIALEGLDTAASAVS